MTTTFLIEFTVKLDTGVNPDSVTFDIPLERVIPQVLGQNVGVVTGYTTMENYSDC